MDTDDAVKATARRKTRFPSSSASAKPRPAPKRKKTAETVRILGSIAKGEL